jgi:hypothetical protein
LENRFETDNRKPTQLSLEITWSFVVLILFLSSLSNDASMRRRSTIQSPKSRSPRLLSRRLTVEVLEDRLPPGDVLLGGGLAASWLAQDMPVLTAVSPAATDNQAQSRLVDYAAASSSFFAASTLPSQGMPTRTTADAAASSSRSAYRDLAGLKDELLDQLLADDFDQLKSAPSAGHTPAMNGTIADGKPMATDAGGISAAGGRAGSLGDGNSGPPAPLAGNGPDGSPQGSSAPARSAPNLSTGLYFANGMGGGQTSTGPGGQQRGIRPFASSVSWPSFTPPVSGGSGGSGTSGGPIVGSSGGMNTGGMNSGGMNTGGMNTGGMNSGGMNTGGMNTGGMNSGGMNTGGMNSSGLSGGIWGVGSGSSGTSGGSGGGGSCNCGCSGGGTSGGSIVSDFMIDNAPGVADHSISAGSAISPSGVRYFDGQLNLTATDLSSSGFGNTWSQTRVWSNGSPPGSFNGTGMIDIDRPYLLRPNGDDSLIVVVSSGINSRFFNLVNGAYVPQFFVQCPPDGNSCHFIAENR